MPTGMDVVKVYVPEGMKVRIRAWVEREGFLSMGDGVRAVVRRAVEESEKSRSRDTLASGERPGPAPR